SAASARPARASASGPAVRSVGSARSRSAREASSVGTGSGRSRPCPARPENESTNTGPPATPDIRCGRAYSPFLPFLTVRRAQCSRCSVPRLRRGLELAGPVLPGLAGQLRAPLGVPGEVLAGAHVEDVQLAG